MALDVVKVARWVRSTMGEADRGVLPHLRRLVAFGNRGTGEVAAFTKWLQKAGYESLGYAAEGDSWAMLLTPPSQMRDTRRVLKALWDASPDARARKAIQRNIAGLHVRLAFTRQGSQVTREWFTRGEVNNLWVALWQPIESGPCGASGSQGSHAASSSQWPFEPSLN